MPRVNGREIRLETACSHAALLAQVTQIGEQVGRAGGKGRNGRLALLLLDPRAEIKPTMELAGIATPS